MNKKQKALIAAVLLTATTLYAADARSAGTTEDPLVTKSYVDKILTGLNVGGNTSQLEAKIAEQEQLIIALSEEIQKLKEGESSTYEVVLVEEGQTIYGHKGTEMIVRAGEGTIVASNAGGIQDVTAGSDINAGVVAPRYHLLITPRDDGRGLLATKKLTVMVRGGYSIG